jgi:hypothetical protein
VAATAQEVAGVLTEKGYRVLTQDYDIPLGATFVDAMHEAVSNSRDLVILFTRDYVQSLYTRKEFVSFEAQRLRNLEERHIVVLRCDDAPLVGLLSDNVYQNLVGIADVDERKRRIIAAAQRHSQAEAPPSRLFVGVPPRIPVFTGRAEELERLDAILMNDKPAVVTQAVGRVAAQGPRGVGKTTLAIEYAYRFRGLYAGVWWCPAETRVGLLGSLAGLAVTLDAAAPEEADVEKAAKAALRRVAEQRATWLLVYDNVSSPEEIADLLPSEGARVLITSRFSDWSGWAEEVALDVLPLEKAVSLLQSRTRRSDAADAKVPSQALRNLPLALDHAAAFHKRTQTRFPGLNWRRGLFRLWIAGVTLFLIAATSISSSGINKQFHVVLQEHTVGGELLVPQLCFNARGVAGVDYSTREGRSPGPWDVSKKPNPFDNCWYAMSKFRSLYPEFKDLSDNELTRKLYADHGVPTRDLPNLWETLGTVSGIAVRIPLVVLILGTSLVWAFLGFRPHTGSSHEPPRRLRRRAKRVAARGTRDREKRIRDRA